jgi:hypothetical protein
VRKPAKCALEADHGADDKRSAYASNDEAGRGGRTMDDREKIKLMDRQRARLHSMFMACADRFERDHTCGELDNMTLIQEETEAITAEMIAVIEGLERR